MLLSNDGTLESLDTLALAFLDTNINADGIAEPSATRSAQVPAPNDAFSKLQPIYIFPLSASRAAPTLKPEYGA